MRRVVISGPGVVPPWVLARMHAGLIGSTESQGRCLLIVSHAAISSGSMHLESRLCMQSQTLTRAHIMCPQPIPLPLLPIEHSMTLVEIKAHGMRHVLA